MIADPAVHHEAAHVRRRDGKRDPALLLLVSRDIREGAEPARGGDRPEARRADQERASQ